MTPRLPSTTRTLPPAITPLRVQVLNAVVREEEKNEEDTNDEYEEELAAEYFAKSEKTFEEVTLKFLNDGLYIYLENYLQKILERIDRRREDLRP